MIRQLIGALGVLTAVLPNRVIEVFERVAIANPGETAVRPWFPSGVRAEGVLVTAAALVGGRPYAWMMNLTGAFGAVVLVFPRLYREAATRLAYSTPETVEWNEDVADGVRLVGLLYVALALVSRRRRRAEREA